MWRRCGRGNAVVKCLWYLWLRFVRVALLWLPVVIARRAITLKSDIKLCGYSYLINAYDAVGILHHEYTTSITA